MLMLITVIANNKENNKLQYNRSIWALQMELYCQFRHKRSLEVMAKF